MYLIAGGNKNTQQSNDDDDHPSSLLARVSRAFIAVQAT